MEIKKIKNNSTSFQMRFIPINNNEKRIIRGLNFLKASGKKHYDMFTKQIEEITNEVEGKIFLSEAQNKKGISIPTIEVETAEGAHYKTNKDGSPAFIYADDFLRGPSAVLAKVNGLLRDNEGSSNTAIKMHDIFINQIAKDREVIIDSILKKK